MSYFSGGDLKTRFIRVIVVIVLFFVFNVIGAAIFQSIENVNYLDAFYFMVVTSTTVGYGDIVPTSNGSKLFVSFYGLFSIALFFLSIGFILGI